MSVGFADEYIRSVTEALNRVVTSQREAIERSAEMITDTVQRGGSLFAFGASHSFIMAEELVYRTGGLMLINPIYPHGMNLSVRPMTMTSKLERIEGFGSELLMGSPARQGDLLLIFSTSGRNAVAIDMALAARQRGIGVIGVTSLDYSKGVTSRHSSGKKLLDLCDVVLDNGAPHGDAAVRVDDFQQPVGPLSTVLGCALINALVVEVAARMLERGMEPPIFMSANLDGGDEYNQRLLQHYRDRIHYL